VPGSAPIEPPRAPPFLAVPNVSEGRRAGILRAFARAMLTSGARLLDASRDPVHHRAVFTLAGDGAVLRAAILALFAEAIEAIDLRRHTGVHPRMGAVDVVPIVPIGGTAMEAAVALARLIGREAAEQFAVPVFLYEAAASHPIRRRLEDVRRGEFEGLAAKMREPDWAPDFGPAAPHPSAGATAVGARRPLAAYNVNLATNRLDIARAVARAVRERTGGLPGVKALGVPLPDRDCVQVTMNLTDLEATPLLRAFERVRGEAARLGVEVLNSEIVGLVPAAALPADPGAALQLEPVDRRRILEARLSGEDFDPDALV
jgi:glutamate formiminotransferase